MNDLSEIQTAVKRGRGKKWQVIMIPLDDGTVDVDINPADKPEPLPDKPHKVFIFGRNKTLKLIGQIERAMQQNKARAKRDLPPA